MVAEDWYRFTLQDGQSATLALKGWIPRRAWLELYDAATPRLAVAAGAANVDQVINNFTDTTADGRPQAYYARVAGVWGTDYTLLVTRQSDFDTEPNDGPAPQVQQIVPGGNVWGHLGYVAGATWVEGQKLEAPDAEDVDQFGNCVSIDGDTAILGCGRRKVRFFTSCN